MTAIQYFLDYLAGFNELSDELSEYLRVSTIELNYPKNHLLLEKGKNPEQLWYLVKGGARVYRYDNKNADDITLYFFQQNQLILPLSGSAIPSEYYISLTKKSTLISLSYVHIKYLNVLFSEYHNISKGFLENMIYALSEHLDILQQVNHKSRYEKLMSKNPDLFLDGNLKDIATFLGMSDSTLKHLRY